MHRRIFLIALASVTAAGCGSDGATKPDPNEGRLEITFGYADGSDVRAASMDLFQMTKNGGLRTPFFSSSGLETDPEWSNDGRKLVFTSYAPGYVYTPSLWVVNADLTGLRQLIVDPDPPANSYNNQIYGSWSPDGASIAFRREIGITTQSDIPAQKGIAVMAADGSGVRWLAPEGDAPSWSVDNRIAFGKNGFIWTVDPDGSGLLRVTSDGGDMFPKWSRDGSRLVFLHVTIPSVRPYSSADFDVVTMRADGTDRRTLVTGTRNTSASWSPDGAYVLYERVDSSDPKQPKCTLHKIPAAGGASVNLTPDRGIGICGGASWRPM
jgi:Tol biopolymer transport system component